ncbi:MAG: hypothetical protein IPO81_13045 [Kouleothrix sp.]|nr:hypothetical protein [Kouleothrix sp.]
MLALTAIVVLAPLLYIPGFLIAHALLGTAQPPDPLERHYERVVVGALLNGGLALALAELGVFSAWLHLLIILVVSGAAAAVGGRRGALRLPAARVGIVSFKPSNVQTFRRSSAQALLSRWETLGFVAVGLVFALLVARPFEVVLGARDAGVYANTGFGIARTGAIVQYDELVRQIALDQRSGDAALRDGAAQAETNFLGTQNPERFIATRMRFSGFLIKDGDLERGLVVPQFFHLYPAWIGLLASLLGLQGGLLATGLLGFLGVWSVGMLGRRLAGGWVGLLGMLFLALNGVQVWFSRYSTSEACAQFLSFAALYAFAVMQGAGGRGQQSAVSSQQSGLARDDVADVDVPSPKPQAPSPTSRALFAGLIAGVAAGQLALARIDFFLIVGPLLLYLLYSMLAKRWRSAHWALAGGLGAMLLQAALHITFISRAYFFDTLFARLQDTSAIVATLTLPFLTPVLREIFYGTSRSVLKKPLRLPIELGLLAVLVIGLALLRRDGRPLRWIERVALRYRRGLAAACALLVALLGVYGYLVRPQILTAQTLAAAPGCLAPAQLRAPSGACLALQGYIGAPIPLPEHPNQVAYLLGALPKWLRGQAAPALDATAFSPGNPGESEKIGIAQANLVRVGWYLSPLGVLLGLAGFALWCWRGLSRASWLFLVASLISTFFFIRLAYGASDLTYIYILRRYIPLTYPAFSLGMAYAIVALARVATKDQGPRTKDQGLIDGASPARRWSFVFGRWSFAYRLSSLALTLALVGFFAATSWRLYRHVEYAGALDQLAGVAGRFEPEDVLLFRGEARDTPDLMITPLKYAFGLNAFAIRSADPGKYAEQLARYVERWQTQGRQVYLALGANGAVELPGLRADLVGPAVLRLPEFQQLRDQKPRGIQEFVFDFNVYRLTPDPAPAAPRAIAVDDYTAQLRGFYHPERIDGAALAWTDGDALLRLPWPRDGAPLDLALRLAPGATRPAALGPARVCLAYLPETSFALPDRPLIGERCVELSGGMADYHYTIDPRGQAAPATGTFLLRIASGQWVPADVDPAQHDQRKLGVQFGGASVAGSQ